MRQIHTHGVTPFMHTLGADYTLKLPPMFRPVVLIGVTALVVAGILRYAIPTTPGLAIAALGLALLLLFPMFILWLVVNQLQGRRYRIRERFIKAVPWRGDEHVLDVGTGSGIMLFGLAKHLTTGKAIGIDLYLPDAGGGTEEIFWKNAHLEGLVNRVELQNVDARKMPFEDQSFDVIVSTFALHHIGHGAADREQALREMVRTLRPGGTIALADIAQMIDPAADLLRQSGITVIDRKGRIFVSIIGRKA
jgi:ubiquinone/menaquinone biosynthesis C-methylase UbiE